MKKLTRLMLIGGTMLNLNVNADTAEIYSYKVKTIDGNEVSMADYKGKALLIVNTASKCGYTEQYDGLEDLFAKYKDRGLVVMGFPSNDFGGQEPGSDAEIKQFCQTRFQIKFPMFAKGPVKGSDKQPLFSMLTKKAGSLGDIKGDIKWNFEKFLVAPDGRIVGRFESKVTPSDGQLIRAIEKVLPK